MYKSIFGRWLIIIINIIMWSSLYICSKQYVHLQYQNYTRKLKAFKTIKNKIITKNTLMSMVSLHYCMLTSIDNLKHFYLPNQSLSV